jgi:hypothetical protein
MSPRHLLLISVITICASRFAVFPMIFVLPYVNRFSPHMTGRLHLGPMATFLIFIMILMTNSVS